MNRTGIEWTNLSANPLKYRRKSDGQVAWACVKTSPGCAHCYSEALALRFERGKVFNAKNMEELEPFLDEKELYKMLTCRSVGGQKVDGARCFIGALLAAPVQHLHFLEGNLSGLDDFVGQGAPRTTLTSGGERNDNLRLSSLDAEEWEKDLAEEFCPDSVQFYIKLRLPPFPNLGVVVEFDGAGRQFLLNPFDDAAVGHSNARFGVEVPGHAADPCDTQAPFAIDQASKVRPVNLAESQYRVGRTGLHNFLSASLVLGLTASLLVRINAL